MSKRRKKRRKRKQESLFGLLLLEALGAIAVLSLVSFSQSARSEQSVPVRHQTTPAETANYRPPMQEKTLPNLAAWRYNTGPNSEYAYPESFHGSRPHSR